MKLHFLYLLIIVLSLQNCDTATQIKMNANADVEENKLDYINFRYPKKLIVVDAWLENEQDSSSFIYDTGAFYTKIEKGLAEKLNLPTVFSKQNPTAQGITKTVEMTSINTLTFSETIFRNIAAGKLRYDEKSYSPCVAKDGIIGANLIKLQNWKVDFEAKRLYFSSTPFKSDAINTKNTIDFSTSFISGIPKIELELQGKTISNVLFDVGFNGGLVLPKSIANEFESENETLLLDQSTAGIFGSNLDTLVVKKLPVTIAGQTHEILVEFSALNKALIGNDFLEHFLVFLNYEDQKITLVQKSNPVIDAPKTFIPGILNDSLWVVNRTSPTLPYKIGDTLKRVNGKQPKELFKNHCDYFFRISELLQQDSLAVEPL